MHCPYCGSKETEVVETRDNEELDSIRRRRACLQCIKRFTTYERVEHVHLVIIKKDGKREQFSRDKLKAGIVRACDKTTVSAETVEKIVSGIIAEIRALDSIEIESSYIGDVVAKRLKAVNQVAYIRFASVFKQFVDIEDFQKEVKGLLT